jgi:ABC-type sugar transport system ATPase subunit
MSRLTLDGLARRPGAQAAVNLASGVPVEVPARQIVALVGRAGSGKTALARMICGLDPPDAGRIDLGGRDVTDLPPHQRRIGLVMQNDALWPHWSLAENIGFPLRCRGIGRKERRHRLHDLLAEADLDGLANRKPAEVSPEACGRALLTRALALEPELLVIDEPFDPIGTRLGGVERIRQVHVDHKLTTLVLTRNSEAGLATADRVGLMSGGRVLQLGTPLEVYARPQSVAIAEAFGAINQVDGVVESADGRGSIVVRSVLGRLAGRMTAQGPVRTGSTVRLLFRPEALSPGSTGFGANRFPVTIVRHTLEGPVCRVDLIGPGGWQGSSVLFPGPAAALREGQTVSFSLPGESLIVVPVPAETAP